MHQKLSLIAVALLFMMGASGCLQTGRPHALSLKRLTESNVQQAGFEEEIPDAPPDPKDPNRLKMAYARWMEEMGNTKEARNQYAAVTQEEPQNVDAMLGVARIDLLTGNLNAAEQGFLKAVRVTPEAPQPRYELGQFYASQKRWTAAVDELTRLLQD